jgi:hypothetical protein
METCSENLIAGDIVKVPSTGLCFFYAGFIPAQGHFVKDAHGNTHLLQNREVPILTVRQQQRPTIATQLVYHKTYFPHDDTY